MRVLLVEDNAALARQITIGLRNDGLAVDVSADGTEALTKVDLAPYDVVLLDRDIPGTHGDEVCQRLVASDNDARILMLTASGTLDDRVNGLGLGADDYLTKPFAMRELVARVRALGRRAGATPPPVLIIGDLEIDSNHHRVVRAGRVLSLSPKEFGLLELLAADPGRVVSAEEILDKVWDEHTNPFTNAVRVTMVTLRRKLGEPVVIETVKGIGYRMVAT